MYLVKICCPPSDAIDALEGGRGPRSISPACTGPKVTPMYTVETKFSSKLELQKAHGCILYILSGSQHTRNYREHYARTGTCIFCDLPVFSTPCVICL